MYPDDSVALVTGAAAGIGRETALAFARAGCRVVLADRDAMRGEAAAAEVRALGRDAVFVATDVACPARWKRCTGISPPPSAVSTSPATTPASKAS